MSNTSTTGSRRLRVAATLTGVGALATLATVVPSIADSNPAGPSTEAQVSAAADIPSIAPATEEVEVVTSSPLSDRVLIAASVDEVEPAPEPEATAAEAVAPEPAPEPQRSVWDRLADCESGSWTGDGGFVEASANWSATAGTFEGGLQFHPDTWDGFKPAGYPAAAHEASREQQIVVGEMVLDAQGWEAWPVCSRKLGLR